MRSLRVYVLCFYDFSSLLIFQILTLKTFAQGRNSRTAVLALMFLYTFYMHAGRAGDRMQKQATVHMIYSRQIKAGYEKFKCIGHRDINCQPSHRRLALLCIFLAWIG